VSKVTSLPQQAGGQSGKWLPAQGIVGHPKLRHFTRKDVDDVHIDVLSTVGASRVLHAVLSTRCLLQLQAAAARPGQGRRMAWVRRRLDCLERLPGHSPCHDQGNTHESISASSWMGSRCTGLSLLLRKAVIRGCSISTAHQRHEHVACRAHSHTGRFRKATNVTHLLPQADLFE
jgi:hypothetical protein